MELKDFIRESFVQISKGIEEANDELKDTSALINPDNVYVNAENRQNYGRLSQNKEYNRVVEVIEFDVAVTASDSAEAGGKFGIRVGSIEIGANGKEEEKNKAESRIRFKVPMVFPTAK
ncbi:MAG: hypothetical protein Q9N68_09235 [Gammaproteobacteria bacterium]|nr:hypothetical protein [Gammaproteobacteria bacterium]